MMVFLIGIEVASSVSKIFSICFWSKTLVNLALQDLVNLI